jgi:hypothetical protein
MSLAKRNMNENTISASDYFKWYSRKRNRSLDINDMVLVIELFVYHKMSMVEISKMQGLTYKRVNYIISLYYKKPEHGLSIMSKI